MRAGPYTHRGRQAPDSVRLRFCPVTKFSLRTRRRCPGCARSSPLPPARERMSGRGRCSSGSVSELRARSKSPNKSERRRLPAPKETSASVVSQRLYEELRSRSIASTTRRLASATSPQPIILPTCQVQGPCNGQRNAGFALTQSEADQHTFSRCRSPRSFRCRSTQLAHTLSVPSSNHFIDTSG